LLVGGDSTVGSGVHPREVSVVGLAGFEDLVLGSIGGVVSASDTVVNVLAEVGSVLAGRVASFEAERV